MHHGSTPSHLVSPALSLLACQSPVLKGMVPHLGDTNKLVGNSLILWPRFVWRTING